VYRNYSNPQDRLRWLEAVRTALEQNKIGWTMWDYQGGFGVVTKNNGTTVEDEGVLRALGLRIDEHRSQGERTDTNVVGVFVRTDSR
jgi:hypothetical protein